MSLQKPALRKTIEEAGGGECSDAVKRGMEGAHTDLQVCEDPEQGNEVGDEDEEAAAERRRRNKEALQRLNIDDAVKSLMLLQMREAPVLDLVDGQLMELLQKCLETDQRRSSVVALSGYIEHFESRLEEDLGWGCGWRNIQMLSSYMLSQNSEAKDVLFGGSRFVPDISAMQQWLEIAWLKGFDVLGAEYFDWKITGTHKWIGTTECAALLRSFGLRARIVDFRTASSKRNMGGMRGKVGFDSENAINRGKGGSGSESADDDSLSRSLDRMNVSDEVVDQIVDQIVEDQDELHYMRLRPDNSEVCFTCVEERKNGASESHSHSHPHVIHNGEYKNITEEQRFDDSSVGGGGGGCSCDADLNHKYMTNWIWNYFSGENAPEQNKITFSSRSPIYFQHRGHSRTIVGIERCRDGGTNKEEDYLIVLDPSLRTLDIMRSLYRKQGWEELVNRGMRTLNQTEYQLCYVESGIAKGDELESLKTLSSVRYMY